MNVVNNITPDIDITCGPSNVAMVARPMRSDKLPVYKKVAIYLTSFLSVILEYCSIL